MWSILLIACIVFQSSVTFFLLNRVKANNDFDKNLRALLLILASHLSTKFLMLAILKDMFLYAEVPTGFSFAYGPLLLIMARYALGRPAMSSRMVFYHYIPFLVFSSLYLVLVVAGATGKFPHSAISGYAAWYQWLAVISMYSYPLYIKGLLRQGEGTQPGMHPERKLSSQIANVLLLSISTAFLLFTLKLTIWDIRGFDLRLLPYMCFAAIPVLVLRYRLQAAQIPAIETVAVETVAVEIQAIETAGIKTPASEIPGVGILPVEPPPVQDPADAPADEEEKPSKDRRYEKSGIDHSLMDEYETTLAAFMAKSRIYLDADLSLEQLASRMKMPKHHLTQLLNERVSKSFYNYVNEYRINEAIARLNNVAVQVNILSLAFDCGFNSRSSFNNYFKKMTGFTPSAYRKNITTSPIQDISLSAAAVAPHPVPADRKGTGRQNRTSHG